MDATDCKRFKGGDFHQVIMPDSIYVAVPLSCLPFHGLSGHLVQVDGAQEGSQESTSSLRVPKADCAVTRKQTHC